MFIHPPRFFCYAGQAVTSELLFFVPSLDTLFSFSAPTNPHINRPDLKLSHKSCFLHFKRALLVFLGQVGWSGKTQQDQNLPHNVQR